MSTPANDSYSTHAERVALRSPATVAALDALTNYGATSPDPRDPNHAPTLKRLQTAYTDAAQADGSFFAGHAAELDGAAEKAEGRALDYPDHAASYLAKAADCRKAAAEARAKVADIVGGDLRLAA